VRCSSRVIGVKRDNHWGGYIHRDPRWRVVREVNLMHSGLLRRGEFNAAGRRRGKLAAIRRGQSAKVPTIGFLGVATPSGWGRWTAAFVQRLGDPSLASWRGL
jgi:hypothetical protein